MGKLISSACDACRQRKIKCCASTPQCSNCRASDIPCKYEMPRRKRGPKPRDRTRGDSASAHGADTTATNQDSMIESRSPSSSVVVALAPGAHAHERIDRVSPSPGTATSQPQRLPSIRQDPMFANLPSLDRHHDFGHAHRVAPWGPSPTSPRDGRSEDRLPSPNEVQRTLVSSVEKTGVTVDVVARRCIDKVGHILFGIIPIFDFRALHASIPLLSRINSASLRSSAPMSSLSPYHVQVLDDLRAFTVLTSICAAICAAGNGVHVPENSDIAVVQAFLKASRDMLVHFEDIDLEHPTSGSITIRLMQSTAFHCIGKTHMSLNVMGGAYRLALVMRLFDEKAIAATQISPQEIQIRRNLFWVMFMSDKSAAVLNDAPVFIHELCLNEPISLSLEGKEGYHLLDSSRAPCQSPYEAQVHQGFYLTASLFGAGHDVLLDLKLLSRMRSRTSGANAAELELPSSGIMSNYMNFCGILDTLPRWLRDPGSHVVPDDDSATEFQQRTFWTQRGNFLVTFHCLRMIILRRAAKMGLCRLIGLIDEPSMIALRKTDIAHDMVSAATSVPFESLQVNGEPLVEKLRQVGIDLLEMIQNEGFDSAISSRAKAIFGHLLDLISRLDSKVSRELAGDVVDGGK